MQTAQQTQPKNVVVIDAKPPQVTREDLIIVIEKLRSIIKETLEAIS
jgi:hypothetical protein